MKVMLWSLLAVGVAVAAFFVVKMGPRNIIGMLRYDQRRKGDLKVGDRAPEIELVALDGKGREAMFPDRTKPTVLIFGSFT